MVCEGPISGGLIRVPQVKEALGILGYSTE